MTTFRTRVTVTESGMPDSAVNTWHADFGTGVGTAARFTAALKTFYNSIKSLYSSSGLITIGDTLENYVGGVWVPLPSSPDTVTPTGSGNLFAASSCMVVSWKTGLSGRANRGRTYLGPFVDLKQNDGVSWGPSSVSLVQAAATALIADFTGGSPAGNLVVWHKASGTSTNVATAVARAQMGTQRRRVR